MPRLKRIKINNFQFIRLSFHSFSIFLFLFFIFMLSSEDGNGINIISKYQNGDILSLLFNHESRKKHERKRETKRTRKEYRFPLPPLFFLLFYFIFHVFDLPFPLWNPPFKKGKNRYPNLFLFFFIAAVFNGKTIFGCHIELMAQRKKTFDLWVKGSK